MATAIAPRSVTPDPMTQRSVVPGRILAVIALVAAAVMVGHRIVPDIRGLGSLVDTAAPWIGLVVPAVLVGALIARSRLAAMATVVPLLVWLLAFGTAWLPAGGGRADIRVANQNVDADNTNPRATVQSVVRTGAEIIGLEEVTSASSPVIAATLSDSYPYHAVESTVQLWSRYPISNVQGVDLGLSWTRALRADVATPKGTIRVYVVHLASARAGQTATRDSTMSELVDRVRADSSPMLVVIGDLNTASTDRILRPLTRLLHDTQAAAGRGLGFTWPAAFPLTRPDHILTRGLTASSSSVLGNTGSDHRGIDAGLRF